MSNYAPTMKFENASNAHIKVEAPDAASPAASDAYMDDADVEDPDLDFKDASLPLWITKLPRHLWESLATVDDDQEIEIGTIRVEGSLDQPQRISLMLNTTQSFLKDTESEFLLEAPTRHSRRIKYPGSVFMFSEKNMPGYKPRGNVWDEAENSDDQGRSLLYEDSIRAEKRKENRGKFVPQKRKTIPKITALAGCAVGEYDLRPARNAEHRRRDEQRTRRQLLGAKDSGLAISRHDPKTQHATLLSASERANITKQAQLRRQRQKDNRAARMEEGDIVRAILQLFGQHRYWGLRDLKARLNQPEAWVKENLDKIAIMHRAGDFNGRWELKDEYKSNDALRNASGVAKEEDLDGTDLDMDMKTEESDDMDDFEDV